VPKIPGVNHLAAVKALEKAGFRIVRQMIPIWDLTGGGETRTVDTPHGRLTLSRYGNLMLDGGRIENLPLDTVVREFKFGPKDYKRAGPAKNSSSPPPNKGLQRTPR
jgi:hypothetical protein